MRLEKTRIGRRLKKRLVTTACILFLGTLSYVIIYPLISKVTSVFMSAADLRDPTVWLIPRNPTFINIKNVIKYGDFWNALKNNVIFSVLNGLLQAFSTTFIALRQPKSVTFYLRMRLFLIRLRIIERHCYVWVIQSRRDTVPCTHR